MADIGSTLLDYFRSLYQSPFQSGPTPADIYRNAQSSPGNTENPWAGAQSISSRGPSLPELLSPQRFADAAGSLSLEDYLNQATAHPFIPYQLPAIYPKREDELVAEANMRN